MEIEEALFAYLTEAIDCPLYPGAFPQQAPNHAVICSRNSGGYSHDLDGASIFTDPSFAIQVRSTSIAECYATAELIRLAIQGLTGPMDEREVWNISLDNETDDYVEPVHANDEGFYFVTMDITLVYPEELA